MGVKQSWKVILNKTRLTYSLQVFNVYDSKFDGIKNKHNVYRDKNCIKKFCEYLREYAMEIINFERQKTM